MNYISGLLTVAILATCAACGAPASETSGAPPLSYTVHYTVTPRPGDSTVGVELTVGQKQGQLRELSFRRPDSLVGGVGGDGEIQTGDGEVRWLPGRSGGTLRWRVEVSHRRGGNGYDAWLNDNWGIFRAEDLIPRARTRTLRGAYSITSMRFELPTGWSAASEYSTLQGDITVDIPQRRFDQPRGWITLGKLGIRRETIAGTRVAIAAPQGQGVRRMDMLALLNWTLPELNALLPDALPRLTVVSAGDPMWRGGLSAPSSIYIHASRPLISENATSTLVHETVHVAMRTRAETGFDWIVEGLAEYYSLELLHRAGAITTRRYKRALAAQSDWSAEAPRLCGGESKAAITALAVVTFRQLDAELRKKTARRVNLDHVIAEIATQSSPITLQALIDIVTELLEEPAETLNIEKLPGCRQFTPST